MHWLGYNDAVSWLNEAKTRIFQPTANFEIYLYSVCLPACQPASQPASQPAVRPGCARCRALEISHDKGNGGGFTKMLFRRRFTHCAMAISFILLSPSLFFFSKVRISPSKVSIACYSGMFSRVLYYIVFAVFQALLAITQLLCHVSALLTSACNVNKRL